MWYFDILVMDSRRGIQMTTAVELHIEQSVAMPDNRYWTNRFEIYSETSDRVYVISQNILKRYWGCSCPGWRTRRKCKHLEALGLAPFEQPQEIEAHHD